MKITYFVLLFAATTILVRDLAAQEETPSTSTNSRVSEKPPVSVAPPPRFSATIAPTYRPRPDTTSRITPTPVPPFNPFSGQLGPHPSGSNIKTFTFPNGERVKIEMLGDDVAFTYANGHRRVVHKHDLDHKPTGAHPELPCGHMLHILLNTNPDSSGWRRMYVDWANHC
jgi:hypothetical protein